MILWETFDTNEIYISIMLIVAYGAFFLFPKRFNRQITLLFLLWGFAGSTLFDFTIGGGLHNFYRVNDSNQYELFDLLTYVAFATTSYFFVYFYDRLRIGKKTFIYYVVGWTLIGLFMERVSIWMNVIHYQHGYMQYYSIIVFLTVQTATVLYYELIKSKQAIYL